MIKRRYKQLDGLRGLFLVIMVLDHFEGPFRKLLYEKLGYFTGAEGFVLISGIVAGFVYSNNSISKQIWKKSFQRLIKIYKYHIITVLVLFTLMALIPFYQTYWKVNVGEYTQAPLKGLLSSLLLLYQPNPIDILPLYIFLVLLMPGMLIMLKNRKFSLFFTISVSLWLISQFPFSFSPLISSHIDFGFFNYASWQLLFFIGIYFGFKKRKSEDFVIPINKEFIIAAVLICIFFLGLKISIVLGYNPFDVRGNMDIYRTLFRRSTLGVCRLLNFVAFSYLVYCLLQVKKDLFTHKALLLLGQRSIQVFTVHIISFVLFFPFYSNFSALGPIFSILYSLAMIGVLYLYVFIDLKLRGRS